MSNPEQKYIYIYMYVCKYIYIYIERCTCVLDLGQLVRLQGLLIRASQFFCEGA